MLIMQLFFFKIGFKPLAETFLKRFFGVFFVNIPGLKTSLIYIVRISGHDVKVDDWGFRNFKTNRRV